MSADDDLFASLGGSLMRDILADLQVDDGDASNWLSLEQLEQELSKLDDPSGTSGGGMFSHALPTADVPPPSQSAASMVVQQQAAASHAAAAPPLPEMPVVDAWSLSLQKFTQSSLEQDFLNADSARKQQAGGATAAAAVSPPPGLDWSQAEDYDVTAPLTTAAPPGLPGVRDKGQHDLLAEAADRLTKQLQVGPSSPEEGVSSPPPVPSRPPPITPQNSVVVPPTPPPSAAATPAQPRTVLKSHSSHSVPLPTMPEHGPTAATAPTHSIPPPMPPPVGPLAIPVGVPLGIPPPPQPMIPPPHMVGPGGPMQTLPGPGMPLDGRPPAWQVPPPGPPLQPFMGAPPPPPPPPPPPRIFCNPHPSAPSVPSTVLASRYMSPRDISYVVHSMMKPLLTAGVTPTDYDVQYFLRLRGAASGAPVGGNGGPGGSGTTKKDDEWVAQMQSRSQKSKEWSATHAVLGHVAKTNVARPRALISTHTATAASSNDDDSNEAGEQRQRASLWRARIYSDQAYQAYFAVLANWRDPSSASSQVVQAQYRRLFKCLGLSPAAVSSAPEGGPAPDNSNYNKENRYQVVDPTPLQLLLKLEKGRVLVARILEQAVLPPTAMQTLLPALLQVLLSPPSPSSAAAAAPTAPAPSAVDDRLFLALTRVVQTLPTLDTLVECLQAAGHAAALASTCRMQSVHAMLQRGAADRPRWDPAAQERWDRAEADLLQLLSG